MKLCPLVCLWFLLRHFVFIKMQLCCVHSFTPGSSHIFHLSISQACAPPSPVTAVKHAFPMRRSKKPVSMGGVFSTQSTWKDLFENKFNFFQSVKREMLVRKDACVITIDDLSLDLGPTLKSSVISP